MVNTILHVHINTNNDPFFLSPTRVSLQQGNSGVIYKLEYQSC